MRSTLLATSLLALCIAAPTTADIAIRGKVTADGEALAKARAQLLPVVSRYESGRLGLAGRADPEPLAETESDVRGLFELAAPEAGMWKVRLEAPGRAPQELVLAPLLEEADLPTAALEPAVELTVRLADRQGQPTAARVSASASLRRFGRRARSQATGRWRPPDFAGTPDAEGRVKIAASVDHGAIWMIETVADGSLTAHDELQGARIAGSLRPELRPGTPRRILVVDERDRPLPEVLIYEAEGTLPLTSTDEAGRATLAVGTEPLALTLLGAGGQHGSHRLQSQREPQEVETVQLRTPATLAGQVVDRDSRRPIPGAIAWMASAGPGEHAVTDARGTYELRPGESAEDALFAGAEGYASGFAQVRQSAAGAAGPTLALAPAALLSGVVVDEAGRPLAVVEVAAQRQGRRRFEFFGRGSPNARSTEKGRFRLSGLPAGAGYKLDFHKEGFAPAELEVAELAPFEERTDLRIVMVRGLRGRGRVIDEAEQPVAGAEVRLTPSRQRRRRSFTLPGDDAPSHASDTEGWFEIPDLAAGRYDLTVEAAGFAPSVAPGIEIPEGAGDVDLGVVILIPGAVITGKAVDAEGRPLAEAEVRVQQASRVPAVFRRLMGDSSPPHATSGVDGGFVVPDQRPGERLDLTVSKEGFVTGSASGVVAPTEEPVVVVLRPASKVAGRVVSEDGEPVAGARIEVQPEGQGGSRVMRFAGRRTETSGDDGRFEVSDIEPGSVTVSAQAAGFQTYQLSGQQVPEGGVLEDVELVLRRGATLSGRVLGAGGGPAVGAVVMASEAGARAAISHRGFSLTDGDGRYEITGLGVGLLTVSAEHEGARTAKSIEIEEGEVTLDLSLAAGVEVRGRVVDAAGLPVTGAEVSASGGRDRWRRSSPGTRSAVDGSFTLTDVAPGTYQLSASKEGLAPSESLDVEISGAPVDGLELRLRAGTTVSGRVLGLPYDDLANVEIRVRGRGFQIARPDYEGRYKLTGLPPGELTVQADVAGSGRSVLERLTLEEGLADATLDLEFGSGYTLAGTAVHGSSPVAGASLSLAGSSVSHSARTTTDRSGAFRLEGLRAGTYRLYLRSYDTGLSHEQEVEVDGDRDLRIEIATGRVAGRVRDRTDFSPIDGAGFTLEPVDDTGARVRPRATSDSRGVFSFGEVPVGVWKLVASKSGYADLETTVEARAGGGEELDLALAATGRLTFEVLLPSGRPPASVRVAALSGERTVGGGVYETTDDGRVSLTTLPPGTWELLIVADQSAAARVQATVPGQLGRVQLPAGGGLQVTVSDLVDGTSATVRLVGPDGRPHQAIGWSGNVTAQWRLRGGHHTATNLAPGTWTVEVTAADGRAWSGSAAVAAGATADVTLR